MLNLGSLAIVLLAATAATPAAANNPMNVAAQAQSKNVVVDPLDKVVCRMEEGLGSRLNRKRVCMTVRDWKDQSEDSRQALAKLQQQGEAPCRLCL